MLEWMQGFAGPQAAAAVLWILAALLLLVLVLVAIRLVRTLTFGTFVAGGRNRKARLAVMDAAAVDSHRRLVLVRRDDIEHLLLIGGPTDVVVERDIRLGQPRRPALTASSVQEAVSQPRLRQPELPPRPDINPEPAPPRPRQPQPPRQRQPEPQSRPRQPEPNQVRQPASAPTPQRPASTPVAKPAASQPARSPDRSTSFPAPRPAVEASPTFNRATPPKLPAATQPSYGSNGSNGIIATRQLPAPSARQNSSSLDDTLLKELEVTFDAKPPRMPVKPPELTLDEEMTKLLGELSNHKR